MVYPEKSKVQKAEIAINVNVFTLMQPPASHAGKKIPPVAGGSGP
jgi:hypothetical protein